MSRPAAPFPSHQNVRSPAFDLTTASSVAAEAELREIEADRIFSQQVLNREVEWQHYEQSGVIDKRQLGLMLDYDKQSNADQNNVWRDRGIELSRLLIHCVAAIHSKETLEYLIVLIDEALQQEPLRALYFHQQEVKPIDPFTPFLRILSNPSIGIHQYSLNRTAHILSILLSTAPIVQDSNQQLLQALHPFLKYLTTKLTSQHTTSRDIILALSALKPLMTRSHTLHTFIQAPFYGLKLLSDLLSKDTANTQFIYSLLFNLWLIAYNNEEFGQSFIDCGVCKKIVQLLKIHVMEKVIRIAYATLAQLLDDHEYRNHHAGKHSTIYAALTKEMIGLNLIQVTDTLLKRKYKDSDIIVDMQKVSDALNETVQELSTFDMYSSEVMSGNLQWSPVHKNELFWRENINKFDERIIQRLIEMLSDDDETVREVACFDLGEIARFHPDGKKLIARLGGKAKLMANLQRKNAKVAKQALLAVQKLMVANWEFLAKSSQGGVASLLAK